MTDTWYATTKRRYEMIEVKRNETRMQARTDIELNIVTEPLAQQTTYIPCPGDQIKT